MFLSALSGWNRYHGHIGKRLQLFHLNLEEHFGFGTSCCGSPIPERCIPHKSRIRNSGLSLHKQQGKYHDYAFRQSVLWKQSTGLRLRLGKEPIVSSAVCCTETTGCRFKSSTGLFGRYCGRRVYVRVNNNLCLELHFIWIQMLKNKISKLVMILSTSFITLHHGVVLSWS